MKHILIVGAGFAGAVIARELAENGFSVQIIEQRNHVGGNCHSHRDDETGIEVHTYGPHIFRTQNIELWNYIQRFTEMTPFNLRVKALSNQTIYSFPVNLHTINQFFNSVFSPEEAMSFIGEKVRQDIAHPQNFEEQALQRIGTELYSTFFYGYTKKQWGCEPKLLPPEIFNRLPIRFNYDDNYFSHPFQGIPTHGYTRLFENMLDHKNITIALNTTFDHDIRKSYDHLFFSGSIDGFYSFDKGELPYRTLHFEHFRKNGDYQGCAIMTFSDENTPHTRITEHKHFRPDVVFTKTIYTKEFSRSCSQRQGDTPYYPIPYRDDARLLRYKKRARTEKNLTFIGRLGTYRYIDMDKTILESLAIAKNFISLH